MYDIGTRLRIIKPIQARMIMPIVGTECVVIPSPPPSQGDSPGADQWIWVRVDKRVRHGIDSTPVGTPYGLHDMNGSVWLVPEDDFEDEDRAFVNIALDADCFELASDPSSVEGYEMALRYAWEVEVERARFVNRAIGDTLHQQLMASITDYDRDKYEALKAECEAHREAGVQGQINWDNCLKVVGLI